MSYRITDEGWMLSGLGATGDELTDVDIQSLTEQILKKILDAKINLEVVKLSLGDLVPDMIERIAVTVAAQYIATQIKTKLELKDKAKASNVADAMAEYIVTGALTELAESSGIPDVQAVMAIDISAAVASQFGIVKYDDVASTPLTMTPGYMGGEPLEVVGLVPLDITRAAICLLGNASVAKMSGINIRSFISDKIEDAIIEFAEWTGYVEPPPEAQWGDSGGRFISKVAVTKQGYDAYSPYTPATAEATSKLRLSPPSGELPVIPIAIGIAAWILFF